MADPESRVLATPPGKPSGHRRTQPPTATSPGSEAEASQSCQQQLSFQPKIGRASCRERVDTSVTGVQTCALPIWESHPAIVERNRQQQRVRDQRRRLRNLANNNSAFNLRSEERRVGKEWIPR